MTKTEYKEKLWEVQKGKCAITGLELESPNVAHLDHSHELVGNNAGRCRGLLHPYVNALEGMILQKFRRSGLQGKTNYIEFLRNLAEYLEKDYNDNPVHPGYVPDMVKKFARLSIGEMRASELLRDTKVKSRAEGVKLYRKALRTSLKASGKLLENK